MSLDIEFEETLILHISNVISNIFNIEDENKIRNLRDKFCEDCEINRNTNGMIETLISDYFISCFNRWIKSNYEDENIWERWIILKEKMNPEKNREYFIFLHTPMEMMEKIYGTFSVPVE